MAIATSLESARGCGGDPSFKLPDNSWRRLWRLTLSHSKLRSHIFFRARRRTCGIRGAGFIYHNSIGRSYGKNLWRNGQKCRSSSRNLNAGYHARTLSMLWNYMTTH